MPALYLLVYDIRPDADRAEYEAWLREVDNPFWNSVDGVVRYENHAVARETVGTMGFPYFDLMWLKDDATLDRVLADPRALEFAAGWIERWGLAPQSDDPADNSRQALARLIAAPGDQAG